MSEDIQDFGDEVETEAQEEVSKPRKAPAYDITVLQKALCCPSCFHKIYEVAETLTKKQTNELIEQLREHKGGSLGIHLETRLQQIISRK